MNKKFFFAGIVLVVLLLVLVSLTFLRTKPSEPAPVSIEGFKVKGIALSSNGNMLEVSAKSTSKETLLVHNFTKGHGSCSHGNISILEEDAKATTFSKGKFYTFVLNCPDHIINNEGSFDVHYHTEDDASIHEISIVFDFDFAD